MFYEIGLGGCWDLCAGALVLEEAGGRLLDPSGAQLLACSCAPHWLQAGGGPSGGVDWQHAQAAPM